MDDQALWFEWTRQGPVDPHEVFQAVKEGGMGLQAFHLLGDYEFSGEQAWLAGGMSGKLAYTGPKRANGKWNLELAGFEKKGQLVEVINAKAYERPKVYQPE